MPFVLTESLFMFLSIKVKLWKLQFFNKYLSYYSIFVEVTVLLRINIQVCVIYVEMIS